MKRASKLFSAQQRAGINAAVAAAERNTSGEIVAVVATRSGRYDRAEDLFGLTLGLLAVIAWWWIRQLMNADSWEPAPLTALSLLALMAILTGGLVLGSLAASYWPLLARPFIPRAQIDQEVERSALEVFYRQRLRATGKATGILIYVSLFERRVRVIGDQAIDGKLKPEDWNAVCEKAVQGMREGRPAQGLEQAIVLAGDLLAKHFPCEPGDRNELPNALVTLD